MEAIELTLENNNSTFNGKHHLQIDGTAMGPKNSCSYAVYLKSTTKFSNMNTSNPCAGAAIRMIVLAYGMDHWKNSGYLHLIYRLSVHLSNLQFSTIVISLSFWTFWSERKIASQKPRFTVKKLMDIRICYHHPAIFILFPKTHLMVLPCGLKGSVAQKQNLI